MPMQAVQRVMTREIWGSPGPKARRCVDHTKKAPLRAGLEVDGVRHLKSPVPPWTVTRGIASGSRHSTPSHLGDSSLPTALELPQLCIGLRRLWLSRCHLSSLTLHSSECRFGDPSR